MPGAPRPTTGSALRTGRPPGSSMDQAILEQRANERAEDLDLTPPPSIIRVDGSVLVEHWTPERRKLFRQAHKLLAGLGLSLVELNPLTQRRHMLHRVTLIQALAALTEHGVQFHEWAAVYLPPGEAVTQSSFEAACAKARVALGRLVQKGWAKKIYREDGTLVITQLKMPTSIHARNAWQNPELHGALDDAED